MAKDSDTQPALPIGMQTSQQPPCPRGSGITVSSMKFPELDGCLVDTGRLVNGEAVYSKNTVVVMAMLDDLGRDDDVR